ncbi:growth factor receptor domain-containing protein [Hygrophoropsis aurantiaca]|uniref:Growth factor receptor domain-containing protein n=1 Tax=Hygrophoropsis aurantiaca TaxID=72124 RepID=A0ACB8AG71_9AGAM|nr:growth factor receptor domain-containing protein [Hygrophoropsis aurantiaca]
MLSSILAVSLALGASVVAQSSPTVLCVAGQCLQGYSNTTIGVTLSASGQSTDVLLLPGEYSSTTNPELLHNLLTSSSASLADSPGFGNTSSVSLPLTVALQPGLAIYPQALYSGQGSYSSLPSSPVVNASIPLTASSLALPANVWAAVSAGSNSRVILWNSIPDVSQLPQTASGALSLLNLQSSSCSPPCSGSGVCSASGTCTCPAGFTGSSCESCANGFFGPNCQACPSGCTSCDDGISGSGRCLVPIVTNPPSSCNCINGECGSNGQCTCLTGWTAASNGTACAQCASGFFLDSTGNCEICQLGCSECADGTGDCITCKSGFTQDANDRTKCDATSQTTSSGTPCPDGSFSNGSSCEPCSPLCQTCTGSTSNDCIICGSGSYSFNGSCVQTSSSGVCQGSNLIANNNKHECDTCGPKCTSCGISNFNVASTINQAQCTGCLPGYVLSQGQCVESCPSGTFLSPQDNLTCTACDSSCSSCAGSASFCLTCTNNLLAADGQCVNSCPSNTFSSSGSCVSCHPDCATCSGGSFNQCTSCNKALPVLTSGRCLPTCSQSQYFDTTSSTCQSCDGSCSSCSGSGPNNCLACSSSSQVLRGGTCASANCNSGSSVVPGLGVCLSELVTTQTSGSSASPLPSITGISTPVTTTRQPLQWWEILLMALGCAFIFLLFMICWRRRARKQRAKDTAKFATAKALNQKTSWRWRIARFGEKLFGHAPTQPRPDSDEIALWKLRAAEEARHNREMEKIGVYEYSRAGSSRAPSPLPSLYDHKHYAPSHDSHRLSGGSMYSVVTGIPRSGPEPRQPVKSNPLTSRFSSTTLGSSVYKKPTAKRELIPKRTDAEAYAASVRESPEPTGSHWITPTSTGGSRNPFRK